MSKTKTDANPTPRRWTKTPMDPAYGHSTYISARVPERFSTLLREQAEARGSSITGVLYEALERYLKEEGLL